MTIVYRSGDLGDCPTIANIIHMASGGVVEYMLHDLVPGVAPVDLVAQDLAKNVFPRTYTSAIIAEDDSVAVGVAFSYPFRFHRVTEEMRAFIPEDRMAHVHDLFAAGGDDGWYLDALGVKASHRRRGIATQLITRTKAKALEAGHRTLNLFVFADNTRAMSVYERTGFVREKRIPLERNNWISHDGGCWWMQCRLNHGS